jgi:RHS repeat-associated protein
MDHQWDARRISTVFLLKSNFSLRISALLILASAIAFLPCRSFGQITNISDFTATPVEGEGHDYIHDLNEVVSPATGSLSVRIAAPIPMERNSLKAPFYLLAYDTSGQYFPVATASSFQSQSDGGSCDQQPCFYNEVTGLQLQSGLNGANGALYLPGELTYQSYSLTMTTGFYNAQQTCHYTGNYVYTDIYGGRHSLSLLLPKQTSPDTCGTTFSLEPQLIGGDEFGTYVGVLDNGVYTGQLTQYPTSSYLTDYHGDVATVPVFPNGGFEDSNGNYPNGTGRTASASFNSNYSLNTLQVPGYTSPFTVSYVYPAIGNSQLNMQLSPYSSGACAPTGSSTFSTGATVAQVPTKVALPNGQSYTFSYDQVTGYVNKIVYPTGAWVQYTWGVSPMQDMTTYTGNTTVGFPAPSNGYANCYFEHDWFVVTKRVVSYDGLAPSLEQDFSYSTAWTESANSPLYWTAKQTTVTTKDLRASGSPVVSKTLYTYTPLPGYNAPGSTTATPFLPVENSIATYDGSGNLLHETVKNWASLSQMSSQCDLEGGGSGTAWAGKFYLYGSNSPYPTDTSEFDYGTVSVSTAAAQSSSGPSGINISTCTKPSGTPIRETTKVYEAFSSTAYPQVQWMEDRACAVGVNGNVNGVPTPISETLYSYDGSNTSTVASLIGHDATFSPTSTIPRGNTTKITQACAPANLVGTTSCPVTVPSGSCQNKVSSIAYDEAGQATSVTDPNQNTTLLSHADNYTSDDGTPSGQTDTYLTQITYPLTVNGSPLSQSFQWDFNKGELRVAIDENKQQTKYSYNDVWDRPTSASYPDGGTTTISYNDVGPNPSRTTTKSIDTGHSLTTATIMDASGHTIQTQLLSDPSGPIYTTTTYDGLARMSSVSNPYRSTSDPTYGITSYIYDGLNRKLSQTNPDGGAKSWSYAGNVTTMTDESGNQWKNTNDSLGNLTQVLEPNGTSTAPSMETDYGYNALNKLLSVTQWGGSNGSAAPRIRTFTYDYFTQLLTATNPESGATSYTYDLNGNLMTKTDGRGAKTSYCAYDAINRPTCKHYSNGSVADAATAISYTYDTSSISGSVNTLGRLTNETVADAGVAESSRSPYSYDPMGRVSNIQETVCATASCTAGSSSNLAYTYNLAGGVASATNGVAAQPITLSYGYDAANRLMTIKSSWSDTTTHPPVLFSAGSPLTSAAPYGDFGLQVAQFGVDGEYIGDVVSMVRGYDNRGRLATETDIADKIAGTSSGKGTGSITVSGTEQSKGPTAATKSTGAFTISGSDPIASVSCTNSGPPNFTETCTNTYAAGTVQVFTNGVVTRINYGGGTSQATSASIAGGIAGVLNSGGAVTAIASGSTVAMTSNTTGTAANFQIDGAGDSNFTIVASNGSNAPGPTGAMTGGKNSYAGGSDSGTLTATIYGQPATASWGSGSTSSSIATALASAINSADSNVVTASASGSKVTITSAGSGSDVDFDIQVSSANVDNADYPTPSFNATAAQLTGGDPYSSYAAYSYGTPGGSGDTNMLFYPNGNLQSVTDSVMGAWSYSYDTLNRLTVGLPGSTNTAYSGSSLGWSYDPWGNRLGQTVTIGSATGPLPSASWAQYSVKNSNNQYTNQVSGTTQDPGGFSYDSAGNVTNDGNIAYVYDAEGRICAGDLDPHPTSMIAYLYDAEGHRVAKGTITGTNPSCDITKNGFQLTNVYVVGQNGEQVSELNGSGAWQHSNVFMNGELLAAYTGTDTVFALNDWLGTKRAEVGASGCGSTFTGFPYGDGLNTETLTVGGTTLTACPDASEIHFTGKERDPESGLDYFGARYYSSGMARWLKADWSEGPSTVPYATFSDPQSLNLYMYVGDNPLIGRDPNGHCCDAYDQTFGRVTNAWNDLKASMAQFASDVGIGAAKGVGQGVWAAASLSNPGAMANAVAFGAPSALQYSNDTQAVAGFTTTIAVSAAMPEMALETAVPEVTAEFSEIVPTIGQDVFRVWGGEAGPNGSSWTPINPNGVANFRDAAGLPNANSATQMTSGTLVSTDGVTTQPASALDGNSGGLPEFVIPDPVNQVQINSIQGFPH